jgi:hypothetical protein
MKMTQAYAWLVAGVLAAGLNASYHDGGLQRVHEIADRLEHNSAAVMELVSGHADRFLSEMRVMTARPQTASCRLSMTPKSMTPKSMALVSMTLAGLQTRFGQTELATTQARLDRFQAMADREQARMEANRARIEAQVARIRIPAVALNPIVFSVPTVSVCPRVRVNVPRLPAIRVPAVPVIHLETASAGPV